MELLKLSSPNHFIASICKKTKNTRGDPKRLKLTLISEKSHVKQIYNKPPFHYNYREMTSDEKVAQCMQYSYTILSYINRQSDLTSFTGGKGERERKEERNKKDDL